MKNLLTNLLILLRPNCHQYPKVGLMPLLGDAWTNNRYIFEITSAGNNDLSYIISGNNFNDAINKLKDTIKLSKEMFDYDLLYPKIVIENPFCSENKEVHKAQ